MNTPIVVKYPSSRMEIPFAESYSESNHRWRYEFHRSKITRCIQPDTSLFGSSQESPISSEYAWAVILCIAQRSGGRHYSLSAPYAVHRQPVLSIRSSFESNNNVLTIAECFWYLGEATEKKYLERAYFNLSICMSPWIFWNIIHGINWTACRTFIGVSFVRPIIPTWITSSALGPYSTELCFGC